MDLVTLALAKGYTDKQIEKVELGEIELDKTLTKEGQAADAKAVGEAIANKEQLHNVYVGAEEPTSENIDVWFNPDGEIYETPEFPTTLPNPHKLVFTGAVTGEYDGTQQVDINIPQAENKEDVVLANVSLIDDVYSIDTEYEVLKEAAIANKEVKLRFAASATFTRYYCLTISAKDSTKDYLSFSYMNQTVYDYFIVHADGRIVRTQGTNVSSARKINGKALSADITLSASDVGALPDTTTTLPNPNALTITGVTTESYDGSAPVTINIPKSLVETAQIGQTIVVKAVDENGKPTEWEPTYLNGLQHIKTVTLTEEVTSITIDTDEDGNPFNVQKLIFNFTAIGGTGNTDYAQYHFYPNPINAGAIRCDVEEGVYPAGRTIGSTGEIQMLGAATYFIRYCPNNKSTRQLAATQAGGKYTSIQSLTVYLSTEGYTFGVGTKLEVYGVSV